MSCRRRRSLFRVSVLLLILGSAVAGAEEGSLTADEEAVVERILELQHQIDELLSRLSPALQDEVRRRLTEGAPVAEATEDIVKAEPSIEAEPVEAPAESAPSADVEIATVSPPPSSPPASPPVVPAPPPVEASPPIEAPPPAVEAPPPALEAPPPPSRRRSKCNTLAVFDENQDGKLSALDRYWRHLYLWRDRDGNGVIEGAEVRSAYDLDVREIAVDLETFVDKKGRLHELRRERQLILDVRGDGFVEGRSGGDDAVLVVDAGAVKRGDGPRILDASGAVLEGMQPFRPGLQVRFADGEPIVLDCP